MNRTIQDHPMVTVTVPFHSAVGFDASLRQAGVLKNQSLHDFLGVEESGYQGRGRPVLMKLPEQTVLVVKSLRHGGLLAAFFRDWFLGERRLTQTLAILNHCRNGGVATPNWRFARTVRVGTRFSPICRLQLATEEVSDSQNAYELVRTNPPSLRRVADGFGSLLRKLHDVGVWHADLNLKNILVGPDGEVLLIDFEGSRLGCREVDRLDNWARLFRSARKLGVAGTRITPRDFLRALRSYDRNEWRSLFANILRRYEQTGWFHELFWKSRER